MKAGDFMRYTLLSTLETKRDEIKKSKRLGRIRRKQQRKIAERDELNAILEEEKIEKAQLAEDAAHSASLKAETKKADRKQTPIASIVVPAMAVNCISVVNGKAVLSPEEQAIQDKFCAMIKKASREGNLELRDHVVAQMRIRNAPLREVNQRLAAEKRAARLAQYESGKRINPIVFRNFPPITSEDINITREGKVIVSEAEQRRQELAAQYIFELKQSGDTKGLAKFIAQMRDRNKPLSAAHTRGVKIRDAMENGSRISMFVKPPSNAKKPAQVVGRLARGLA